MFVELPTAQAADAILTLACRGTTTGETQTDAKPVPSSMPSGDAPQRQRAANELEQAEQAREAVADLDPLLSEFNARQMSKQG